MLNFFDVMLSLVEKVTFDKVIFTLLILNYELNIILYFASIISVNF